MRSETLKRYTRDEASNGKVRYHKNNEWYDSVAKAATKDTDRCDKGTKREQFGYKWKLEGDNIIVLNSDARFILPKHEWGEGEWSMLVELGTEYNETERFVEDSL